ncbi:MAG: hypothetical protein SPJ75_04050 [Candidatus Onthomorpha sp.]|nr:hypothetical protein [Bacteroidales bacterium]MDD7590811.1 hypothetical protein [Bacteroidales bacterium]MDY5825657.1 hypothetical protein [Candidatus Onthomorpha sp.]
MNAKDEQTQLVDEQTQIIEETVNEEQETSQESKLSSRVKKVAGVAGVAAAGVAAGVVFTSMASGDNPEPTTQAAHTAVPAGNVKVAEVSDDMSFDEAFASARKQVGAGGVFEWRGKLYGTYYKNEWDAMSQADKDQYAANVFGTPQAKVHNENIQEPPRKDMPEDAEQNTNVQKVSDQTNNQQDRAEAGSDEGGRYNIQQVYGVRIVTDNNGNPMTMVEAKVNGHNAILCDINQDDKIDSMAIDANDDGQITQDEIIPVPQGSVLVSELGYGVPETQPVSGTDMSDVAINPMEGLL